MALFDKTSNPAFTGYFWDGPSATQNKMSLGGIFIKTLFSLLVVIAITGLVWTLHQKGTNVRWYGMGGMISAIVISILLSVRRHWAHILVPLYAVAKGFFLGGFTAFVQSSFPNLPYQAVAVTLVSFFVVLMLYQTRIIVVTKKLRSVIITVCASIFLIYIISWILSFFGLKSFIWGTTWYAIGFNVIAATFAALSLLLDFDYIEKQKHKAPKYMEWFATYGLLVTLIWLYVEILRLMRKFAIRF